MLAEAAELAADAARRLTQIETPAGPFGVAGVVCRVTAGAGGAEARDWAAMLHSMYRRWAARAGLDCDPDNETGVVVVRGPRAAALLGEQGVHRLARVSPHDPRGRVQTSFAAVAVTPAADTGDSTPRVWQPGEVRVETFKGSGPGGQHRNTRDTAVRAVHVPTGVSAVCASERSQHRNRQRAMEVLAERVVASEQTADAPRPDPAARGSQIRSYVLHPRPLVVDHRTGHRSRRPAAVLAGNLESFLRAWTAHSTAAPAS